MHFGIAFSGGGSRGAAHIGVLKALEEEGLFPAATAGASAGSIVAGLYALGYSVSEMESIVYSLSRNGCRYIDVNYLGLLLFLPQIIKKKKPTLSGFLKGNKLHQYLCDLTQGAKFFDIKMKLVIPAVDLNSGKTIAFTNVKFPKKSPDVIWENDFSLCDVMMASSSVPGVFEPQILQNYCLVDGGVTNVMPVDLLIAAGEKKVLAIDIGEDYQMLDKPTITEVITHSFAIMSNSLKECTSTKESYLLKPALPKDAGLLTFHQMMNCMEAGYKTTKQEISAIKKALSK